MNSMQQRTLEPKVSITRETLLKPDGTAIVFSRAAIAALVKQDVFPRPADKQYQHTAYVAGRAIAVGIGHTALEASANLYAKLTWDGSVVRAL